MMNFLRRPASRAVSVPAQIDQLDHKLCTCNPKQCSSVADQYFLRLHELEDPQHRLAYIEEGINRHESPAFRTRAASELLILSKQFGVAGDPETGLMTAALAAKYTAPDAIEPALALLTQHAEAWTDGGEQRATLLNCLLYDVVANRPLNKALSGLVDRFPRAKPNATNHAPVTKAAQPR